MQQNMKSTPRFVSIRFLKVKVRKVLSKLESDIYFCRLFLYQGSLGNCKFYRWELCPTYISCFRHFWQFCILQCNSYCNYLSLLVIILCVAVKCIYYNNNYICIYSHRFTIKLCSRFYSFLLVFYSFFICRCKPICIPPAQTPQYNGSFQL